MTLTGEGEAGRRKQELSRVADSLQRTYKAVTPAELWNAKNAMSKSLVGAAKAADIFAQSIVPLADTQRRMSEEFAQSVAPLANTQRRLFEELAQSLGPLAETQRTLSGVIAQSMAVPDLGLLVSQNNAIVAKAIEDIQAVYSAPNIRIHGFDKVLYPGVLRDIQEIGASYRTLLSETAKINVAWENLSETQHSWAKMLIPSSTVANFTHSLRSEVVLEQESESVTLTRFSDWENPHEMLERLLTDLEPDLVGKWQGSWQALRGSNPDRLSQAAFSYRELIRMVLDVLAPDVEVDHSEQSSKRKMQVRQVLDGREGDFAGAMVEGLPKLYDFFSKSAHTFYCNEVAVQAALMAGDGLLLILLSSRRAFNS